jgi:hypothetical protein
LNKEVADRIDALATILTKAVSSTHFPFGLNSLKQTTPNALLLGDEWPPKPSPLPRLPKAPGFFARLIPGSMANYKRQCAFARQNYESATSTYNSALTRLIGEVDTANAGIDELAQACTALDAEAIAAYFSIVLKHIRLPEKFSDKPKVAYDPKEKHLLVEVEALAPNECIPRIDKYKYTKTTDKIEEVLRSEKSTRSLYADAYRITLSDVCMG